MNPISSLFKRFPQPIFWAIAWGTSFFGFYMSERDPEGPWLFFLYGPLLGGILVTALADGRSGLKTYFSRIVRWRVGLRWYAVALFLPLALRLAAFGLNLLSGATMTASFQSLPWNELLISIIFPSFLGIALAEEPGFRGFALPRFLVGRTALLASLILGLLHSIWHLPLFISGSESPLIIPIIFAGAIFNTWLFNHTNGSVLLAMLMHTSVDFWVRVFNPLFSGPDAQRQTLWLAVVYVAVALLLPLMAGVELGRRRAMAAEPTAAQPAVAQ